MKKIEAIVEPSSIEALKEILAQRGIRAVFTVAEVHGFGTSAQTLVHRGRRYEPPYVTEAKIEMVVGDEAVDAVTAILRETAKTDEAGESRVFVWGIENPAGLKIVRKKDSAAV